MLQSTSRTSVIRRANHSLHWSHSSALSTQTDLVKQSLRELLRETAQPVAVVTSTLPLADHETAQHKHSSSQSQKQVPSIFHGATLSSFTSIALDPHPLVAFSLRVPSRMALALNACAAKRNPQTHALPDMVINILSAAQSEIARIFSRPDLHPSPFADSEVHWMPSAEGLPVIKGALGALSCTLIGRSLPLSDTRWMRSSMEEWGTEVEQVEDVSGLASELFIARVLRVENIQEPEGHLENDELRTLPLLYHQRKYVTVGRIPRP